MYGNGFWSLDLQQRDILRRISCHVAGLVHFAIGHRDVDFHIRGPLHHVLVGHDVSRRIHEETAAEALHLLLQLAAAAASGRRRIG